MASNSDSVSGKIKDFLDFTVAEWDEEDQTEHGTFKNSLVTIGTGSQNFILLFKS